MGKKKYIPFTLYTRPHGKTETIFTLVEQPRADMAMHCIGHGYRFEAEVLMNGMVSLTCAGYNPDTEQVDDIAIEVTNNENEGTVVSAVQRLIDRAHELVTGYDHIRASAD